MQHSLEQHPQALHPPTSQVRVHCDLRGVQRLTCRLRFLCWPSGLGCLRCSRLHHRQCPRCCCGHAAAPSASRRLWDSSVPRLLCCAHGPGATRAAVQARTAPWGWSGVAGQGACPAQLPGGVVMLRRWVLPERRSLSAQLEGQSRRGASGAFGVAAPANSPPPAQLPSPWHRHELIKSGAPVHCTTAPQPAPPVEK